MNHRLVSLALLLAGCGTEALPSTQPTAYFDSGLEFPTFPGPCTLGDTAPAGRWSARLFSYASMRPIIDTSEAMPLQCGEIDANTTRCRWGYVPEDPERGLRLQLRFVRPLVSLAPGTVLRVGDDFIVEGFSYDRQGHGWWPVNNPPFADSFLSNLTFTVREAAAGSSDAGVFTRFRGELVGAICRGYDSMSVHGEVVQTTREVAR